MDRTTRKAGFLIVVAALLGVSGCVDGRDPTAPDLVRSVRLAVSPVFSVVHTAAEVAGLTHAHVTALDASGGGVLASIDAALDPNLDQWTLDLVLEVTPGVAVNVELQVELSSSDGTVEWSGKSARFAVQAGTGPLVIREIAMFRGPLANLDVTALKINGAPTSLLEGETGQLRVEVSGGGPGTRVFFRSLDPTVASVDATGHVEALAPGTARIEAQAGPASAQVSFSVEKVVVPDAGEIEASVSPMLDYAEGVVGSMGDPAGAAAVSASLGSLGAALASGNGASAVRAFNDAVTAWANYGAGTSLRVLDGPQLSLVELSLIVAADALGIPFG